MKPSKLKLLGALALFLAGVPAGAQTEPVTIPITDPSEPVTLQISRVNGSIEVEGADIGEVQIIIASPEERKRSRPREDGLRRIPNASVGMYAEERDNVVVVGFQPNSSAPVLVRVPRRTQVKATTVNGGDLRVSGLQGELELRNTNGSIYAENVAGTIVASTTNGRVVATIIRVDQGRPMSFNTLNGKIDVTLPPSTKADLQLKTNNGEILTDFDMDIESSPAQVKRSERAGHHKVHIDRSVRATINGGGPDFHFTTFNGDIIIRKAER